jgi:exodeoxyribonuclease V alpha subunit
VISGGPGTGKTTTVTKILALLRQQPGGNALRIALAAPTGKAAARLQESIRATKSRLQLPDSLIDSLPERASTLHRLLGARPSDSGYRYHRDNPLPLDVLILDEASMVDVAMMTRLLEALTSSTRLILLGDKDQLASVEAGAVLGDICSSCLGPAAEFAAHLSALTGEQLPYIETQDRPLCDAIVVLQHSYRFAPESPIGRLATVVNQGDSRASVDLLARDPQGTLSLLEGSDAAQFAAQRYLALFEKIQAGASVTQLFTTLEGFRLLCALRQGPAGSLALNQRIAQCLQQMGVPTDQDFYPGRPVMVIRNDHQLRLYNGDIGIVLPNASQEGGMGVGFLGEDRTLRWMSPNRLPPHESVYAMTVHKSQGSEFDEVLMVLPEQDTPLLTRELLYTGITRSRQRFTLAASLPVLQTTVERRLRRHSGLAELLRRKPR